MNVTTRMVAAMSLMGFAVAGAPAPASAGHDKPPAPAPSFSGTAMLYELTENMKVVQRHRRKQNIGRRVATSAITGVASPGSPLCPVPEFQSGPAGCAVNVDGQSNVSLLTGLGTIEGSFATVLQGDNPVDGPEAVVLRGEFRGRMDFSPAILHQVPFGTVSGRVRTQGSGASEFSGVFRLPFAGNVTTDIEVAPGMKVTLTLRQLFCPATPDPNPNAILYGGFDLAYLDNVEAAATPAGRCLDIQPHELSLGTPLVRLDINF